MGKEWGGGGTEWGNFRLLHRYWLLPGKSHTKICYGRTLDFRPISDYENIDIKGNKNVSETTCDLQFDIVIFQNNFHPI